MVLQGNDKADQVQDFIATDLKQQIVFCAFIQEQVQENSINFVWILVKSDSWYLLQGKFWYL